MVIIQVGVTALMCAEVTGRCDVVTELISLGADVDMQDNVSHFLCFIILTLSRTTSRRMHSLLL